MKKLIATAVALLAAMSFAALPANAAPSLSGSKPSDTTENQTVPLNFNLSGVSWANVLVTISVAEGGLTVTPTGDVIAAAGYTLTDGTSSTQGFRGSLADVKSVLASGINWLTPATPGTYSLDVTLKVQEYIVGLSFNPANGHYYQVPDETLSGAAAFAAAAAGDYTYAGLTGYLAVINDADENTFVAEYSGGEDIWIGGTSDSSILNAQVGTSFANDAASLGKWYWVEEQVQFTEGINPTVSAVGGRYNSWAPGEPNESGAGERCVVTNWSGDKGLWNDLACGDTWSNSFIIEFEPAAGSAAAVLTLTTEDLTDPLADTGVSSNALAAFALAAIAAGVVAVRVSRKRNA